MRRVRTAAAMLAVVLAVLAVMLHLRGRRPVGFWIPPEPEPVPEGTPRDRQVLLANRTLWTAARAREFPSGFAQTQRTTARGTAPYLVVSEAPVSKQVRERIAAAGARPIRFLPVNAMLVEADAAALRRLRDNPLFAAAFEVTPVDKLQRALAKRIAAGERRVQISVETLASEDRETVRAHVAAAGGEILEGCLLGPNTVKAAVPAETVYRLVEMGEVVWVEGFARPKLLNDKAVTAPVMNVESVWNCFGGTGFRGENQILTTSDSGIDTGDVGTLHPDLRDNVIGFDCATNSVCRRDLNGHGTHTAGSIVGTGEASEGQIKGTAPAAKLWAWFCLAADGYLYMPEKFDDLFRPAAAAFDGKTPAVHSASWGVEDGGAYDSDCAAIDDWLWRNPDFLPVFAVGNVGNCGSAHSPAVAKNCLAVGSVQNLHEMTLAGFAATNPACVSSFSSRGPCADGRIKPDVVAPGEIILSTRSSQAANSQFDGLWGERYAYLSGTSMATPLVAGAAAIVRQKLMEVDGYTEAKPPTAALLKAVLMGGAADVFREPGTNVTGPAPNNVEGWGRINLGETLLPSNRLMRTYDRLPFAAGRELKYYVTTTNAGPLDVQLVWTDYPGSENSGKSALVNDLDLEVVGTELGVERRWLGNGGDTPDRINPAESVRIASAPAGTYCIVVKGWKVPYDFSEGGAAALYVRGVFASGSSSDDLPLTVHTDFLSAAEQGAFVRTAAASPDFGTVLLPSNGTIRLTCGDFAYGVDSTGRKVERHVCLGWTGTGSVPAAGSTNWVDVTVTNESTITWRWADAPADYLFSRLAYDDLTGMLLSDEMNEWCPSGLTMRVGSPELLPFVGETARLMYGHNPKTVHYCALGVSAPSIVAESGVAPAAWNPIVFYHYGDERGHTLTDLEWIMDEPLRAYYIYEPEDAVLGNTTLPYWWYTKNVYLFYLGRGVKDEDLIAADDPDGDGFSNQMECTDETDPLDEWSWRFTFDGCTQEKLMWTGGTNCSFAVERTMQLGAAADWRGVWTNSEARTSVTNELAVPSEWAPNGGFFRVRALKPAAE